MVDRECRLKPIYQTQTVARAQKGGLDPLARKQKDTGLCCCVQVLFDVPGAENPVFVPQVPYRKRGRRHESVP